MVGHFGVEEDIVEIFADARRRLLKPDAIVIPQSLDLFLVPACLPEFAQGVLPRASGETSDLLRAIHKEMKASVYHGAYLFDGTFETLNSGLIGLPQKIKSFDLTRDERADFTVDLEYTVVRDAQLTGMIGWFRTALTDDIAIRTSLWDPRTHWKHCYFPLDTKRVTRDETVRLKFSYRKEESCRFKLEV